MRWIRPIDLEHKGHKRHQRDRICPADPEPRMFTVPPSLQAFLHHPVPPFSKRVLVGHAVFLRCLLAAWLRSTWSVTSFT